MFKCFLLLFLFIGLYLFAGGDNYSKILMTGNYHGEDVNTSSGEIWLALIQKETGFYLEEVRLKIDAVHDVMVDGPGEKSGKAISIAQDNPPILIIAESLGLKAGKVKGQAFPGHYFKNDQPQPIQFNGKLYHLKMDIPSKLNDESQSNLDFSSSEKKQTLRSYYTRAQNDTLFVFGDQSAVGILWAGDLDRDGQPDLIMSLSDHYNVMETALLLSSKADKGELIKLVATFRATGC